MSAPEARPAGAPEKKKRLPETTEAMPWLSNHEVKKEANPFEEKDWRMFLYAWSGLAVRFVIVLGAIFSVVQFLEARKQARIERALAMVELWEKPEYQTAQRALKTRIEELNMTYAAILGDQPTANDRAVVMKKIGQEAMSAEGGVMPVAQFQDEFERIVYFLNRAAFCVEGNICSREVIDAYFGDYTRSFWAYFAGYVDNQRKTISPTYAQPLETYILRAEKATQ